MKKSAFCIVIEETGEDTYSANVEYTNTATVILDSVGLNLEETLYRVNYAIKQAQGKCK